MVRAADLVRRRDGATVRVAGSVIVRQRPGTAKGFVFLSLEDETGIANVIVTPGMFARNRLVLGRITTDGEEFRELLPHTLAKFSCQGRRFP